MNTTILGIAGGSGSGKTSIAKSFKERFAIKEVQIVHLDAYYSDLTHLSPAVRSTINFDHPDAIDHVLLLDHLVKLKQGFPVNSPVYDFANHSRKSEPLRIVPCSIIIVEGIYALMHDNLRQLYTKSFFVDTDPDIRLIRRIGRDMNERGRTLDSICEQYLATVRPMHSIFVESCKNHADVILQGEASIQDNVDSMLTVISQLISFNSEAPGGKLLTSPTD